MMVPVFPIANLVVGQARLARGRLNTFFDAMFGIRCEDGDFASGYVAYVPAQRYRKRFRESRFGDSGETTEPYWFPPTGLVVYGNEFEGISKLVLTRRASE
jgi:hypothetical protein